MNSFVPGRVPSRLALIAVGWFLVFASGMAALAGSTLLWPGTPLDKVWVLNKLAYAELSAAGRSVGGLFLLLSAILVTASVGWFRRRRWGWRLTVCIISTQVAGDFVNLVRGAWLRGGMGMVIAGALLFYLVRPTVRSTFY